MASDDTSSDDASIFAEARKNDVQSVPNGPDDDASIFAEARNQDAEAASLAPAKIGGAVAESQAMNDLYKGVGHGLMAFPNAVEKGTLYLMNKAGNPLAADAQKYQANRLASFNPNDVPAQKVGNVIGTMVSAAPASILGGEAVGAGMGAVTRFSPEIAQAAAENPSAEKYAGSAIIGAASGAAGNASVGQNPLTGAVTGAVLGAAAPAIADAASLAKGSDATQINSEVFKEVAQQKFAEADALGGQLKPEAMDSISDKANTFLPRTEIQKAAADSGSSTLAKEAELLNQFRGKPLSFADANYLDTRYSDLISENINPATHEVNNTGRQLQQLQQHLRETMLDPANSTAPQGSDGFSKFREAQQTWAAQLKLRDIEKINDRAELMSNPASARQVGYRQLASRAANGRTGWQPDEIAALRSAAKNGKTTNLLNLMGSRLNPIAFGAAGGLPGAGIAYVGSAAARNVADKIEAGKANKIIQIIAQRPGVNNALGSRGASGILPNYINHLIAGSGIPASAITQNQPSNNLQGNP